MRGETRKSSEKSGGVSTEIPSRIFLQSLTESQPASRQPQQKMILRPVLDIDHRGTKLLDRVRSRSRGNSRFIIENNGLCPISSHWYPLDSTKSQHIEGLLLPVWVRLLQR